MYRCSIKKKISTQKNKEKNSIVQGEKLNETRTEKPVNLNYFKGEKNVLSFGS
jgi:hypothetical protein